jgi:DNA modification methylase
MKGIKIEVNEIPLEGTHGKLISIKSNGVTAFTHGIHKYPAKFIPHIPRWAICKYGKDSQQVVDPFCGCGTTLVEAFLHKKKSFGLEISPLARLITKVKTTPLDPKLLKKSHQKLLENFHNLKKEKILWKPSDENLSKWFKEKTINKLAVLRSSIENISDIDVKDFFLVIFSSIIRKVSNAEDKSQKVYISSRFPKPYIDPFKTFFETLKEQERKMIEFSLTIKKLYGCFRPKEFLPEIIERDALSIRLSDECIDLVITSPPYINAINYIDVHKLEYMWLNLWPKEILNWVRKIQVGSDYISSKEMEYKPRTGVPSIDEFSDVLSGISPKHSFVFSKFYDKLKQNFKEVKRILTKGGKYIVVIGNNRMVGLEVPNNIFVKNLGESLGFNVIEEFSYVIKNRMLRIPRKGRGGDIGIDHIIVFEK